MDFRLGEGNVPFTDLPARQHPKSRWQVEGPSLRLSFKTQSDYTQCSVALRESYWQLRLAEELHGITLASGTPTVRLDRRSLAEPWTTL